MSDTGVGDRCRGVLVGPAAGDRIGGPIRMAVRLAESLLDCGGFAPADILTYADQTNRAFYEHGTAHYEPTLDDLPNTLVLKEEALPDLKDWNEAVTRVADLFGHAVSRLLNASNVATLASKVGESVTEYKGGCDGLPDRLQLALQNVGVGEADAARADRVRTAKAVKALLAACDGKEPTALVGVVAGAKLDTSGTSMGRSLKSAGGVLDALKATRWDLFSAVSQIEDARKASADRLLEDVRSWLKADEHALAGGVAAKLSEAEGRAIKLLTPPRQPTVPTATPLPPMIPPQPQPSDPVWRTVQSDARTCLTEKELLAAAEELVLKLRENPRYRLTIRWTLEEGRQ